MWRVNFCKSCCGKKAFYPCGKICFKFLKLKKKSKVFWEFFCKVYDYRVIFSITKK